MYNKGSYRGEIMDKKSKVLYIISLIFSVFSLIGIICLFLLIFAIKAYGIPQYEYDPEIGLQGVGVWAIIVTFIALGYAAILILFWMMIFINSVISLVLVIIYKCKTKKERVVLGYNISVLSLQLIVTLIWFFQ